MEDYSRRRGHRLGCRVCGEEGVERQYYCTKHLPQPKRKKNVLVHRFDFAGETQDSRPRYKVGIQVYTYVENKPFYVLGVIKEIVADTATVELEDGTWLRREVKSLVLRPASDFWEMGFDEGDDTFGPKRGVVPGGPEPIESPVTDEHEICK